MSDFEAECAKRREEAIERHRLAADRPDAGFLEAYMNDHSHVWQTMTPTPFPKDCFQQCACGAKRRGPDQKVFEPKADTETEILICTVLGIVFWVCFIAWIILDGKL